MTPQEALEAINSWAHQALEALAAGDLAECRTALKAITDECSEQLEGGPSDVT